jgi:hypothetical protein
MSKERVCGRSLAGVAGSNPAGDTDVCVVCCTLRTKRQSQDNQDKEVQIKYKERTRRNPGEENLFRTNPDRLWGPYIFLSQLVPVSFPGIKRLGRGDKYAPPFSTEVKERVEPILFLWPFMVSSRTKFYSHFYSYKL